MSEIANKVLVIGYGNPGRQDDGLGPALAAALEAEPIPGVRVDADYQLTVEDGAEAARHEVVIFVDAAVSGPEPFSFQRIEPVAAVSFSTHSVSPESVLGLAHELFAARTAGFVLAIRGYRFNDFEESLSEGARANLAAALDFIRHTLHEGTWHEVAASPAAAPAIDAPSRTRVMI